VRPAAGGAGAGAVAAGIHSAASAVRAILRDRASERVRVETPAGARYTLTDRVSPPRRRRAPRKLRS
jgi:hypothetical protein